jgi:hypothetical protein
MVVHSISVVYGTTVTHDEAIKLFADAFYCWCDLPPKACNCLYNSIYTGRNQFIAGEIQVYPLPHDCCPRDDPKSCFYPCERLYVLGIEVTDFDMDRLVDNKPQSGTPLSKIITADAKFTKELLNSTLGVFLASRPQGVNATLLLIKGD